MKPGLNQGITWDVHEQARLTQFCVPDTQPLYGGLHTAGTHSVHVRYIHSYGTHTLSNALSTMAHPHAATELPFTWNTPCRVPMPKGFQA